MNVIETEQLRKVYRRFRGASTVAVEGLDLAVPEGGVFGFLGPNGSGKTTPGGQAGAGPLPHLSFLT